MLHYNKLYQSLKKVNGEWHAGHVEWGYTWIYLKFFEKGTCILGYIGDEKAESINTWFTENHPDSSIGTFNLKNDSISINFNLNVKNEGQIQGDKIILHSVSKINPVGTWDIFTLVE